MKTTPGKLDYFIKHDNRFYAGNHFIIDLYDIDHTDNQSLATDTMRKMAAIAGATLLHIHVHPFSPYGGLSGVAILAESHISFHSWPEARFASWDIFMCGATEPEKAIQLLQQTYRSQQADIKHYRRGEKIHEQYETMV